jgi:hypothetical protein
VGPRVGLDAVAKREIQLHHEPNPSRPTHNLVLGRHIKWCKERNIKRNQPPKQNVTEIEFNHKPLSSCIRTAPGSVHFLPCISCSFL